VRLRGESSLSLGLVCMGSGIGNQTNERLNPVALVGWRRQD
jgi:hypothetical protein